MKLTIAQKIHLQTSGAICLLLIGVLTIVAVVEADTSIAVKTFAIVYGASLLCFGFREFGQARARSHGISVENKAFADVERICGRYGLMASHGAYKPGLGDVDLILSRNAVENGLRPQRDVVVAVEIKAYERFSSDDERMVHAAAQAQRTASSLNTCHCIVWLPKAKPTLWHRIFGATCNDVPVILGKAVTVTRMASTMLPE